MDLRIDNDPLDGMSSLSMSLENLVKDLPVNNAMTELDSMHIPIVNSPPPQLSHSAGSSPNGNQSNRSSHPPNSNSNSNSSHNHTRNHNHNHNHSHTPHSPRRQRENIQRTTNVGDGDRRVLLVAAGSRAKQVAGSIAQTIREAAPPLLSAVGPASVNQAVKAIAIARTYLEQDNIDISCEISRKPGDKIRDLIHFALIKHPKQEVEREPTQYEDLKSSAKSKRSALAGAIANNIREKKRPRITSIGKGPVFQAVTSIVKARKFLVQDKLDLRIVPMFTHVTFENGATANAMQFLVNPIDLSHSSE